MDRIIAISAYLREKYNCKHCGQVLEAAEVAIEKVIFGSRQTRYSASCPECASFIRWMPQNIVGRMWYKGSMHEIAKFETSLLQWFLRVEYGSPKVQKDIQKVLFERIDVYEPKEWDMSSKEQTLLNQINILETGLETILEKYNLLQESITVESHEWDYFETKLANNKSKVLKGYIIKQRKELDKIKNLLKEIR